MGEWKHDWVEEDGGGHPFVCQYAVWTTVMRGSQVGWTQSWLELVSTGVNGRNIKQPPKSSLLHRSTGSNLQKYTVYIYINIKVLFCGLHPWLHKKTSQCWRTKWAASDVYDYESFWQRDQLKILLNVCETCRWLFVSFCLCCCL